MMTPFFRRHAICLFLVLTAGLTGTGCALAVIEGSTWGPNVLYIIPLLGCPGLAALVTIILTRQRFKSLGWQWGHPVWLVLGCLLPLAYALPAYGLTWLTGLGRFTGDTPANPVHWVVMGTLAGGGMALGGEIGWRGFLVPALRARFDFTRTALTSGLAWCAWFVPLFLVFGYHGASPVAYGLACFFITTMALSVPLTWLRLRSGSSWPGALLYGSHKLYIGGLFDGLTEKTGLTPYVTGQFGIALVVTTVLTAVIFYRLRHRLADPDVSTRHQTLLSGGNPADRLN